jgi:multidrug resistance efflux pump
MNWAMKLFFMLACVAALAACGKGSSGPTAAAAPAPTTSFAAIARGRVDVEGGLVRINAPRDGIVGQLPANVGDAVKQGDVLAVLDFRQAKILADIAQAELGAATTHVAALRARLPGLQRRAGRVGEAASAGAATGQAADDARQAQTELQAEIAEGDAAVEAARQKLNATRFDVEVRTLRAPVAGHIVERPIHLGDAVSAQVPTTLFVLLPDGPRIVRAELNDTFVANVKVGMTAEISPSSDDSKIYSARVVRIGEVFGPTKLSEDPQELADARDVECILQLQTDELRVGQRVQVRIKR